LAAVPAHSKPNFFSLFAMSHILPLPFITIQSLSI
jgi:hypothetical protein